MKRWIPFVLVALAAGAMITFALFETRPEPSSDPDLNAGGSTETEPSRPDVKPIAPDRTGAVDEDRVADLPRSVSPPEEVDPTPPSSRPGRISGRILDADTDQPLEGAIVAVRREDGIELEVSTNFTGSFRIDDVEEGEACNLIASARDHRTQRFEVRAGARASETDTIVLRLELAHVLRGRVVDEHGSGVAARIEIRRGARRWMVECEETGEFVIEDILHRLGLSNRPPARLGQLWVRSDVHRDAFVEIDRDDVLSGAPLEVRVVAGASIAGRCVAPGEQPLAGVEITCYPLDESPFAGMRTARTDATGRFVIGGLGPGRHHLEAQATFSGSAPNPRRIECELAPLQALETTGFTYSEGSPIRGRVIAKLDESPLHDRIVVVEHDEWFEPVVTLTDHDGSFAFGPFSAGEYRVVLRGESWFDPSEPQTMVVSAGAVDLLFVVDEPPRDGALRLELRDAESGARLEDLPLTIRAWIEREDEIEPIVREGRTDGEGAFVVSRLPRAKIRGRVAIAGYARSTFEIEIDAPEQTIVRELSISRGVTVRGRVFDAAGLPIDGAAVIDFPRDDLDVTFDPDAGSSTGRSGEFELRNVDPGAAWICAFAEGLAPARVAIEPGGRDVYDLRVDLATGSSVTGIVLHESGAPARRYLLEFAGSIASQRTATDDRGRFEFSAVEPGPFAIEDGDGFVLHFDEVSVGSLEIEIVVPDV